MDLDEQLVHFDRLSELAYERTLQAFADERKKILAELRRRLIANYPVELDDHWYHSPAHQREDRRRELAAAVKHTLMELKVLGL